MDEAATRWLGWAVGTLLVLAALSSFLVRYAAFSGFLRETERMALSDGVVREEAFSTVASASTSASPHVDPGERMSTLAATSSMKWTGQAVEGYCNGICLQAVRMEESVHPQILLDGKPIQEVPLSLIDQNRIYRFIHEVAADGTISLTRYETVP